MTFWQAFPSLAVALALHGAVTRAWWIDAALVVLALVGRERLRTKGALLPMLATVVAASAAVLVGIRGAPVALGNARGGLVLLCSALALAGVTASVARAWFATPPGGRRVDLALAAVTVICCGPFDGGARYTVGVSLFSAVALFGLHRATSGGVRWRELNRRPRRLVGFALALATSVGVASAFALVPMHHVAWRWIMERSGALPQSAASSSFGEDVTLTTDTEIALSDEPVLEVTGTPIDYLRGAVLTTYSAGHWAPARELSRERQVGFDRGARETELRAEQPLVHLFTPLGADEVATPSGRVNVDGAGVMSVTGGAPIDRVWLTLRPDHRCAECSPPGPKDLSLPIGAGADWRRLAQSWVSAATTTEQKIAALTARFAQDFRYSLKSHHRVGVDPVWDFLTTNRVGHCESFASGMVLLLRASGVPARVVTGYRVTEYDSLNHRYVVRQKHAHAWVEAWDPASGWRTADPTPSAALGELYSARTPWQQRAWRWSAIRLTSAWSARGQVSSAVGVVVLGAIFVLGFRAARRRLKRRPTGPATTAAQTMFDAFARRVRGAGVERAPHETLEAFAQRVREGSLLGAASAGAAVAVERYAALRYGGAGDASAIERGLREAAEGVGGEDSVSRVSRGHVR